MQKSKTTSKKKKELVYRYSSLWAAAQDLEISYDRLTNVLSGRTRISKDEIEKLTIRLDLKRNWYEATDVEGQ